MLHSKASDDKAATWIPVILRLLMLIKATSDEYQMLRLKQQSQKAMKQIRSAFSYSDLVQNTLDVILSGKFHVNSFIYLFKFYIFFFQKCMKNSWGIDYNFWKVKVTSIYYLFFCSNIMNWYVSMVHRPSHKFEINRRTHCFLWLIIHNAPIYLNGGNVTLRLWTNIASR